MFVSCREHRLPFSFSCNTYIHTFELQNRLRSHCANLDWNAFLRTVLVYYETNKMIDTLTIGLGALLLSLFSAAEISKLQRITAAPESGSIIALSPMAKVSIFLFVSLAVVFSFVVSFKMQLAIFG